MSPVMIKENRFMNIIDKKIIKAINIEKEYAPTGVIFRCAVSIDFFNLSSFFRTVGEIP